ncbi:MmgE/PrpD family protein [Actinophytocola oryzae]|uniref:2-methylcitrate dehydratase PrpD n=1 Tax=Actinophytocola oryzae TaxID=502181 RepID=A0A4R7W638_9PSEU|nr:MmgE/PrpD family protein [Actinophytocola oryzae]TDV57745.1 2-methylcitrate dehydratase PrpD [Actinophytocola oryzae]
MTLAAGIAEFVVSTRDVPAEDLDVVARSVFDTVGAALAGATSPQGRIVGEHVRATAGPARCTVLGAGYRTDAASAAYANGTFAHSDDFDDMGGYGHPSAPLVPALLAVAEHLGTAASGRDLCVAHCLGFEVAAALCGGYDQYDRCFHSTPVFGVLGATCGVARLLGLSVEQTVAALAIAATEAAGLGRATGTMVKPLHAGQAARNAVVAGLLARQGATGSPAVFEARGGFLESFVGHRALDADALVARLGAPFRAARTLFVKRFPCCGSNHSAVSALLDLVRTHGIGADDVDEVVVHGMTETSPVLRYPSPADGCEAKFSIRYALAAVLVRGGLGVDDFRDERWADPPVVAAMEKVRGEVVSRWTTSGAHKRRGNPITVRLRDGRELTASVPRSDLVGGPKAPLPEDQLLGKFRDNARRSLPAESVAAAEKAWRAVESTPDVRTAIATVEGSGTWRRQAS